MTTKAKKRAGKKSSRGRNAAKSRAANVFQTFSMHAKNPSDANTFRTLRSARASAPGFAIAANTGVANTDPETVARGYLKQALASDDVPSFTAPETKGGKSDFKSLGTETLPLTNTKTVKFRQTYNQIPIYSSLVTVELDENNEFLAINSAISTPSGVSPIAKVAPADAVKRALTAAGSKTSGDLTPKLYYYFDKKGDRWRLVYIIEDVPLGKPPKKAKTTDPHLAMDFVIDAHTGSLVAELPRTPTMAGENEVETADGLGIKRLIRFQIDSSGKKVLVDERLNISTFDFAFRDPEVESFNLPGKSVVNPPETWPGEAVSAHANAAAVASFLRDVLMRNNIDNQGGPLVSTVNCRVVRDNPLDGKQWLNAAWTPFRKQMLYGQVLNNGKLRSLAVNLDIVGHEMFHGVTDSSSRLEYLNESGALNESYSDIFGVIISNFDKTDIADWEWEIGENLRPNNRPFRDFSKPSRFRQPEHMSDFEEMDEDEDHGGVHTNSGIHNFAAFKIMTAKDSQGRFMFTPTELAAMFYISLTQHLSRISGFSASRRGVTLAAQTLFRNDPQAVLNVKIRAVSKGFDAAGIEDL